MKLLRAVIPRYVFRGKSFNSAINIYTILVTPFEIMISASNWGSFAKADLPEDAQADEML